MSTSSLSLVRRGALALVLMGGLVGTGVAQPVDVQNQGAVQRPKTRAEVRAELVRLEQAGYNPATANPYDYPQNIQAAEAKVAREDAQRGVQAPAQ